LPEISYNKNTQVRVGSLQELVYKQGQAGVTKATVTIVFNNEDKSQSPIGYEQHDEITVSRQVCIGEHLNDNILDLVLEGVSNTTTNCAGRLILRL
jgi:chromosome segregation ATPase